MATILIIEDHLDTVDIYQTILATCGYDTLTATDGPSGLDMALSEGPDLVVLDVGLPRMDGWAVLEHLKADERGRSIPVLVVTAHGDAELARRLRPLLCDEVVVKPIAPRELVRRIQGCLGPE